MASQIEIVIADDQKTFRQGLARLLAKEELRIIGEAENGNQLIQLLKRNVIPHIVLLDIEMPVMNGIQALRVLKRDYPQVKIIMLTMFTNPSLVNKIKSLGADCFLHKNNDAEILIETIASLRYLKGYSNFGQNNKLGFSPREIEMIPLILKGKTNQQIAIDLDVSEKTIETHRNRLYEKTNTKNASEFSSFCTREGLAFLGF